MSGVDAMLPTGNTGEERMLEQIWVNLGRADEQKSRLALPSQEDGRRRRRRDDEATRLESRAARD